jgi:hypothetical protein
VDQAPVDAARPRRLRQLRTRSRGRVLALDESCDGGGGVGGGGVGDPGGDPPLTDNNPPTNVTDLGSPDGSPYLTNAIPDLPPIAPELPSYADSVLQQLAPGIVQGAGALDNPVTYVEWYGFSAFGGSIFAGPEVAKGRFTR